MLNSKVNYPLKNFKNTNYPDRQNIQFREFNGVVPSIGPQTTFKLFL